MAACQSASKTLCWAMRCCSLSKTLRALSRSGEASVVAGSDRRAGEVLMRALSGVSGAGFVGARGVHT